jgi:hypothetical protein
MNESASGLRLPVQGAVDRKATYAALSDGTGVEAAQDWQQLLNGIGQLGQTLPGIIQALPSLIGSFL